MEWYERKTKTNLQNDRMNNIGVLDGQIEGHTSGRSHSIAADKTPGNSGEAVPVINNDDRQQGSDTGAE